MPSSMFSCIARFQPIPKISVPAPARKAVVTRPTRVGETPSRSIGGAIIATPSMPSRSGRSRRTRSRTTVVRSRPTASADSTMPHACRPTVSSATAGPRVSQAPAWIAFSTPKPTTTIHSHGVAQKNDQPSRSSRSVSGASARGGRAGRRTGTRSSAARSQVAASTARAQPEPTVTTRSAPIVGPRTIMPLRVRETRALAGWRSSRGTSWGSTLAIAGNPTPDTMPWTTRARRASRSRPRR